MNAAATLKKLKALDWSTATASLWVVHRRMAGREASYRVSWINIDAALAKKLRSVVTGAIDAANEIAPYKFITADQDHVVYALDDPNNDFSSKIAPKIQEGHDGNQITNIDELHGAHAYVIQLTRAANTILAFRTIPDHWDTKKLSGVFAAIFKEARLLDAADGQLFRIDRNVDSFFYQGSQFILNKVKFERGLNFRTGMIAHRDQVIKELCDAKVIKNPDELKQLAGDNMRHLRSLASILKEPKFKDAGFIEKLRKLNTERNWGLVFTEEGLVVNDANMALILVLLQDKRMLSLIQERLYDAEVAHPVS